MTALARLARSRSSEERPRILSTTIAALLQRVPPLAKVAKDTFSAAPGNASTWTRWSQWLEINGYTRNSTVRDTGDYAVRGGIVDLFPPALAEPIRLDFFGDTLESIRTFDPETQRTVGQLRALDLVPMSEVQLTTESIKRFRQGYTGKFGGQTRGDNPLRGDQRGAPQPRARALAAAVLRAPRHALRLHRRRAARARRADPRGRHRAASARSRIITTRARAPTTAAPANSSYKPLEPSKRSTSTRRLG